MSTLANNSSLNTVPNSLLTPLLVVINHVLRQEPWALTQLQPFAGKSARLELPMLPFAGAVLTVQPDGTFAAPASESAEPNVTIALSSQALSAWATGGQAALMAHVRLAGDAEFANTLSTLAKNLRWDVEEDLSKWLGDAFAFRIVQDAQSFKQHVQDTGNSVRDNLLEYLTEEQPTLVRKADLEVFSQGVNDCRDYLARLEKRLAKLNSPQ